MSINYRLNSAASSSLNSILQKIKETLQQIDSAELECKCEFILEELITNTYMHSLRKVHDLAIEFYLNHEKKELDYMEIGVLDFDFTEALKNGEKKLDSPSLNKTGGIGLILIKKSTSSFKYIYHSATQTSHFNILI